MKERETQLAPKPVTSPRRYLLANGRTAENGGARLFDRQGDFTVEALRHDMGQDGGFFDYAARLGCTGPQDGSRVVVTIAPGCGLSMGVVVWPCGAATIAFGGAAEREAAGQILGEVADVIAAHMEFNDWPALGPARRRHAAPGPVPPIAALTSPRYFLIEDGRTVEACKGDPVFNRLADLPSRNSREWRSCYEYSLHVQDTGPQGGDLGHGARLYVTLKAQEIEGAGGMALGVAVGPGSFTLATGGEDEREGIEGALRLAAKRIQERTVSRDE